MGWLKQALGIWDANTFETRCRLSSARLKFNANRRTEEMKQVKREIAQLMKDGKQDHANIRVESVISIQNQLQAYSIMSLYLEQFAVRAQLIGRSKEIPRDMVEAVSSTIYASRRMGDVPELEGLREMFRSKYGSEYAYEAGADTPTCNKWQVNANLIKCLLVEPPANDVKVAMLSQIAQEHQVENWDLHGVARELLPSRQPVGGALIPPPGPPPAPKLQYIPPTNPPASKLQYVPPANPPPQRPAPVPAAALPPVWKEPPSAPSPPAPYAAPAVPPPAPAPTPQAPSPPPEGWMHQYTPPVAPPPSAGESSSSPAPGPPPINNAPPGQPGHYVERSPEEIQRAYDAAVGPPAKGELYPGMDPLNLNQPPAVPTHAPAAPAPPAPPPPPPALPTAASGSPPGAADDMDDLSRRLAALKRR